jgi:hypothetical protein
LLSKYRFNGYCKNHTMDEIVALLRQKAQASVSQKNESREKRRAGRPVEDRTQEYEQLRIRFESVVLTLYQELPTHKIKRPVIQKEYQRRGETITDPSTITKRVQILYGEKVSVDDAVARVINKNRENNSSN